MFATEALLRHVVFPLPATIPGKPMWERIMRHVAYKTISCLAMVVGCWTSDHREVCSAEPQKKPRVDLTVGTSAGAMVSGEGS